MLLALAVCIVFIVGAALATGYIIAALVLTLLLTIGVVLHLARFITGPSRRYAKWFSSPVRRRHARPPSYHQWR